MEDPPTYPQVNARAFNHPTEEVITPYAREVVTITQEDDIPMEDDSRGDSPTFTYEYILTTQEDALDLSTSPTKYVPPQPGPYTGTPYIISPLPTFGMPNDPDDRHPTLPLPPTPPHLQQPFFNPLDLSMSNSEFYPVDESFRVSPAQQDELPDAISPPRDMSTPRDTTRYDVYDPSAFGGLRPHSPFFSPVKYSREPSGGGAGGYVSETYVPASPTALSSSSMLPPPPPRSATPPPPRSTTPPHDAVRPLLAAASKRTLSCSSVDESPPAKKRSKLISDFSSIRDTSGAGAGGASGGSNFPPPVSTKVVRARKKSIHLPSDVLNKVSYSLRRVTVKSGVPYFPADAAVYVIIYIYIYFIFRIRIDQIRN